MSIDNIEKVIDRDRPETFRMKLGIDEVLNKKLAIEVTGGVALSVVSAALVSLIGWACLPVVTKILIVLGVVKNPLIMPVVVVFATGIITILFVVARKYSSLASLDRKRRFASNLDAIGKMVSDAIFLPAIGMAMADGKMSTAERKKIYDEYRKWGFDKSWYEAEVDRVLERHTTDEILKTEAMRLRNLSTKEFKKIGVNKGEINFGMLKDVQMKLVEKVMWANGNNPSQKKVTFYNKLGQIRSRSFWGRLLIRLRIRGIPL